MTQHIFKHGVFHILTGWDRPMKTLFLSISLNEEVFTEDELENEELIASYGANPADYVIHSTMFTGNMKMRADEFEPILKKHNLPAPMEILAAIIDDKLHNRGNVLTEWVSREDGKYVRQFQNPDEGGVGDLDLLNDETIETLNDIVSKAADEVRKKDGEA